MTALRRELARLGHAALFLTRVLSAWPALWKFRRECFAEMREVGNNSVVLVALTSAFAATSIALQGWSTFSHFGGQDLVGVFVALAVIREMGPVLAGAMAGAKYGAAAASALANMNLKEQIDALEVMSVDPYEYLVFPRLAAAVLMTPLLVLVADAAAVGVGALYADAVLDIRSGAYWDQVASFITAADLKWGMAKGAAFGLIYGLLCCYFGLHGARSTEGVGQATNRAIVSSATLIVLANAFLSEWIYGG